MKNKIRKLTSVLIVLALLFCCFALAFVDRIKTEQVGSYSLRSHNNYNCYVNCFRVVNSQKKVGLILKKGELDTFVLEKYVDFLTNKYNFPTILIGTVAKINIPLILGNNLNCEYFCRFLEHKIFRVLPFIGITEEIYSSITNFKNFSITNIEYTLVSVFKKTIRTIQNSYITVIINNYALESLSKISIIGFLITYKLYLFCIALIATFSILIASFVESIKVKNARHAVENEQRLKNITQNINGGVLVVLPQEDYHLSYHNEGFFDLTGTTLDNHTDCLLHYIHPSDLQKILVIDYKNCSKNEKLSFEIKILRSDNKYIPTLFNCTVAFGMDNKPELYCVILDISEQKRILNELQIEKKRLDFVINKSETAFFEISNNSFYASDTFKSQFDVDFNDFNLNNLKQKLENSIGLSANSKDKLYNLIDSLTVAKVADEQIVNVKNTSNKYVWYNISVYPVLDNNENLISVFGKTTNAEKYMREKLELERLAKTDPMTGLFSKTVFNEMIEKHIEENSSVGCALIFLDLDSFKQINDTFGHTFGDNVIVDTANKLRLVFSNMDIVSRFGGDEFCVFVKNIPLPTLREKLGWLLLKIEEIYEINEQSITSIASIGISYSINNASYLEMLDTADTALYKAKASGKNSYSITVV